jgi:hypothetical protein
MSCEILGSFLPAKKKIKIIVAKLLWISYSDDMPQNGTEQQPQKKKQKMNEIFTYNSSSIMNNGTTFFNSKVCTYEIQYKVDGKEGQLLAKGENEETVRADAIELFRKKGGKDIQVWIGQVYL